MDFDYSDHFQTSSPEAYERLLLDVIAGDATLFMRRDSVEASWHWIAPILERWTEPHAPEVCTYPSGDWGPVEAARLIDPAYQDKLASALAASLQSYLAKLPAARP